MIFSVQADEINLLKEALKSNCNKVRFGSEFCEWKIPSLSELEKAYKLSKDGRKEFAFVTPRISDSSLRKIRKQLNFLNEKGKIDIVINDLGVLNILSEYPELNPYLGRQLVYIPARSPWLKTSFKNHFLLRTFALFDKFGLVGVENIYSQTSLNYIPTIRFYQEHGVQGIDLDFIPRCFPYYDLLANAGFNISIHSHLVPVTITRKCHTARFLSEKTPENCSRPCNNRVFLLKRSGLETKMFLHGNVVFRFKQPSKRDIKKLFKINVTEFVISMSPLTKILSRQKIDELVRWLT